MTITWQGFVAAITPSLQALIFSALTALGMTAGITYLKPEKAAVASPAAPQSCVAAAPARTPQTDQTKLQLVGIQNTLDQIAEVAREINGKECVARPQRAAAKVK